MKRLLPALVFVAILAGHFLYITRDVTIDSAGPWASYEFDQQQESRWERYVNPGEYWLGLSYGLAGAFAVYCLGQIILMRRKAIAASSGGLALSGVIAAGVCFFTGCCGSPMLPIYMGLFGSKYLGVTKPLTFLITLLSISAGYAWMMKRAERAIKKNVDTRLHENA